MIKPDITLENLDKIFPENYTKKQLATAKTSFLKKLSLKMHRFYAGKIMTVPKAGLYGFNWFNLWYTPGVSSISTTIRDNYDSSFELTSRGNTVAIVSDSTRVLGDGDCTPPGGLGVMEGKAYLMKYLGGVDAVPLCIDSKDENGNHSPEKIIDFVKMVQHSFGAINLEDISQPNCYKVLDTLREECKIPVWHDDAQGTACVVLAALLNAIKVADKKIEDIKIVMLGAGAANTTIARLIIHSGANPANIVMFDSKSSLHKDRADIQNDKKRHYRKWELCQRTNPNKITKIEEAANAADVLIALSKPDPDFVKPTWIKSMAEKAIVFACANPVPEIYPSEAKKAGAYIVATGRGDFPNQANNSIAFPGILKGALIVKASKITDNMAVKAAETIAEFAEEMGISPDFIIPKMTDRGVFPKVAAEVAAQAITDGVARNPLDKDEVYKIADKDIKEVEQLTKKLMEDGFIKKAPLNLLQEALDETMST
ncbi:MAG: NADP-dependent malic enzyme [Verrucomicrobiota bacterium]|nr:NADP-dependent malic enzyme [Verrucomicrobiota bacterium]